MILFPEFLKKYTTIPNKFIDDFFEMFENTKNFNNNFFISIDKICFWLSQTKGNIKRTLLDNFSKNIDYTLKKIKVKIGRGRLSAANDIPTEEEDLRAIKDISNEVK